MERPGIIEVLRILEGFRAEIVRYLRSYGNGTIMRRLERRWTEEGQVKEHFLVLLLAIVRCVPEFSGVSILP